VPKLAWDPDAETALSRAPFFVRPLASIGVNQQVEENTAATVTVRVRLNGDAPSWPANPATVDYSVSGTASNPADHNAVQNDRLVHCGPTPHGHIRREHAIADNAAYDTAGSHQGIEGLAHTKTLFPFIGEDELCRRHRHAMRVNGPVHAIEVKVGVHTSQVHIGVPIGIERPHVTPVG